MEWFKNHVLTTISFFILVVISTKTPAVDVVDIMSIVLIVMCGTVTTAIFEETINQPEDE